PLLPFGLTPVGRVSAVNAVHSRVNAQPARGVCVPEPKRSVAAQEASPSLRHDGVRQILTFSTETRGDWHLALEIEQLGDGELVGVGTLSAAALVTAAEPGFELVV